MTLIELLVVVLILGLLSVAVLPNLAGTTEGRRFRESARGISSFIARAQSRAINAAGPRGFMVQPLAADPRAGIDMFMADAPPPYGGESSQSRVTVTLPAGAASFATLAFDSATTARLADGSFAPGDAIQFGGLGPTFMFTPPSRLRMWTSSGQSPSTTPWPRTPPGGTTFRIMRQPRRASSGAFQAQRGAGIDIAWSCLGTRPLQNIVTDNTKAIVLLFDAAGRPHELVHSGGLRERITEPLFFLVGSPELAGKPPTGPPQNGDRDDDRTGANWQQQDAVWLCLDNHTGVVKFGTVTPGAADVLGSQLYIRQTVGQGVAE